MADRTIHSALHSPPGFAPSGTGGELPSLEARFRTSINGNQMCHCIHVTELQEAAEKIEQQIKARPQSSNS